MIPRLDQVDLRLLRVFATVVECRGFSAAQVELGVGQSTISSHMADLEAKLDIRLCERGRGGFRLTDNGREVYEAAQRLFRSLETFTSDVEAVRGRLVGELHIGTVDNLITNEDFRLSEAIARYKSRASSVRLTVHVGTPTDIERAVIDGRLQLGLGGYTNQASGIDYIKLFNDPQNLYCARSHALFEVADELADLDRLRRFEHVKRGYVPDSDLPFGAYINATAQASNIEAIALLILSGRFIGFLPTHYARRWVAAGAMRAIRPDVLHYFAEVELIVKRNRAQHSLVDVFIDDLLFVCEGARAAAE